MLLSSFLPHPSSRRNFLQCSIIMTAVRAGVFSTPASFLAQHRQVSFSSLSDRRVALHSSDPPDSSPFGTGLLIQGGLCFPDEAPSQLDNSCHYQLLFPPTDTAAASLFAGIVLRFVSPARLLFILGLFSPKRMKEDRQ